MRILCRGERFSRNGAPRSGYKAYACSKLALSMFARELQRRARSAAPGLDVFLAHPGVAVTDAFRKSDHDKGSAFWLDKIKNVLAQPAATGAVPLLYTATAPELEGEICPSAAPVESPESPETLIMTYEQARGQMRDIQGQMEG